MTLPPNKPSVQSVRNQKRCKLLIYGNPEFVTSVLCNNCVLYDGAEQTRFEKGIGEVSSRREFYLDTSLTERQEIIVNPESKSPPIHETTDDESVDSLVTRTLLRLTSKRRDYIPQEEDKNASVEKDTAEEMAPEKALEDLSRLLRISRPLRNSFATKMPVTERSNIESNEGWFRSRVQTLKDFFENLHLSRKSSLIYQKNDKPSQQECDDKILKPPLTDCVVTMEKQGDSPFEHKSHCHYQTEKEMPYEVDNYKVIFKKPARTHTRESQDIEDWEKFYGCKVHVDDLPHFVQPHYDTSKIFINSHDLSTFTLDTKRMEEIHLKTKNAKMCRCALRFLVIILALAVFVASIIGLSLYCTRGSRFFGAL